MHGGCGLLALTMTSREFTTTEKDCAINSWCRFKDEGSIILRSLSGYRSMMTLR